MTLSNCCTLSPLDNESAAEFANRLAKEAAANKTQTQKQKLGQFFTPPLTASAVARFFNTRNLPDEIDVLDPCAGTGILSCVLIEKLAGQKTFKRINLTCYEIDESIAAYTTATLEYLKKTLSVKNTEFNFRFIQKDFITACAGILQNGDEPYDGIFDFIIANPPFFKLKPGDERIEYFNGVFNQPNIYTLFLLICARLLKSTGQLSFLIPSSFCAGSSFALFRQQVLKHIILKNIHVFNQGHVLFDDGCVLNNFIVIYATKGSDTSQEYEIEITNSADTDFSYKYIYSAIANQLPLPVSKEETELLNKFSLKQNSIKKMGLEIIQGGLLRSIAKDNSCCNISDAAATLWMQETSAQSLPEYIKINKETSSCLMRNSNYVLLRKYNKHNRDEKIKAFCYFKEDKPGEYIGIDNQYLCIYKPGSTFTKDEVKELSERLNDKELNHYLKIIYGNINIGISEISEAPL